MTERGYGEKRGQEKRGDRRKEGTEEKSEQEDKGDDNIIKETDPQRSVS